MYPANVAIFSPHLDDAALSCADHAFAWLKRGASVTIITVFTAFPDGAVCDFVLPFMKRSGYDSSRDYERQRKQEDLEAMAIMGVRCQHLDFPDAGFRAERGQAAYNTYRELCPGHLGDREQAWVNAVGGALRSLGSFDRVLAPLGVGGHIDHLIVQQAARRVFPRERLRFYAEFPYARNPMKWSLRQAARLLCSCESVKWISGRKREVLNCYRSQIRHLFRGRPRYPEIVLTS